MKFGGSSHQKTLECDSACDSAWCKLQFDAGNVLSVYGAAFTIGRLQSNHLAVEDARLSGTHCCLVPAAESGKPPILTDTSTNGTFVAGEKLHKSSRQLQWGEHVEVVKGNKNLCFVVSNSQEKRESSECMQRTLTCSGTLECDDHLEGDSDTAQPVGGGGRSEKKRVLDDAVSEEMNCSICMRSVIFPACSFFPTCS
jgi:hypothetical protein